VGRPQPQLRLEIEAGLGVVGDHKHGGTRHVTLLCAEDWAAACRELGHDVDPVERRANVLLSGGDAGALIGATVRIGPVLLAVQKETQPCHVMDAAAQGLREALEPECRAGVWARVIEGGVIESGHELRVIDEPS